MYNECLQEAHAVISLCLTSAGCPEALHKFLGFLSKLIMNSTQHRYQSQPCLCCRVKGSARSR